MKYVRKLPILMFITALMLGIMHPSALVSAKSVDDYDWSGEMQPVFLCTDTEGASLYNLHCNMDEDKYYISSYLSNDYFEGYFDAGADRDS